MRWRYKILLIELFAFVILQVAVLVPAYTLGRSLGIFFLTGLGIFLSANVLAFSLMLWYNRVFPEEETTTK